MNNSQAFLSSLLFLFSFTLNTSCTGQEKTSLPQKNSSESDLDVAWVDPLFFIKGQLCQHVRKIYQDRSGNIWFGTNVYDLMLYDGDTLKYYTEKDGFGGGRVTEILEDKKGNVWFGTYGGVTKYDGKTFTNSVERDSPFKNDIWSLLLDSKGTFWVGTTEGLRQFDEEKGFTIFPIPKAAVRDTTTLYAQDRITCIMEDKKGILWFGTDGFGICKYDGKTFSHITKQDGLPDNCISDLMEDKNGDIWISTMFGGVSRYNGKTFTNFTKEGVITGIEVSRLYEAKNGDIWFAAENHGVYQYNGKSFTNYNKKDGLNTNGILCMLEDKEGRFWFGGWGGLFRFDGKSFASVTKNGPWN